MSSTEARMSTPEAAVPRGVSLWEDPAATDGAAVGLTPDRLSRTHPLWEMDVQAFGPFSRTQGPVLHGGPQFFWRSDGHRQGEAMVVAGPCTSALDAGWELAEAGLLQPWDAVLAVSQCQGRGRVRRPWASPPGNLYVAWAWPPLPKPWLGVSSLLAGLALCQALQPRLPDMQMKWPNDLLADEAKVGGILVEERGDRLLVGFGLNMSSAPQPEELRVGAAVEAGYLNTGCGGLGPLGLWRELSGRARKSVQTCLASSPRAAISKVERMLAWRGLAVRVRGADGTETSGVLAGLAEDGGLRLRAGGYGAEQEQVLYSGSILPLY